MSVHNKIDCRVGLFVKMDGELELVANGCKISGCFQAGQKVQHLELNKIEVS